MPTCLMLTTNTIALAARGSATLESLPLIGVEELLASFEL